MKRGSVRYSDLTRRTYHFELAAYYSPTSNKLNQQCSQAVLRRLLTRMWKKHGKGRKEPKLEFVTGRSGYWTHPDHTIHIRKTDQQCRWVLIHEITHALGYWEHDARFNRKCIELISECARKDKEPLLMAAQLSGLRVLG